MQKEQRRLAGSLRFNRGKRGGPGPGVGKYQTKVTGEVFGEAAGCINIQQREEDKDRRAKCRIETKPHTGDRRRDGCSVEITARPAADR